VPNEKNLTSISRSHFELGWDDGTNKPSLRKLSGNPLLLDNQPLGDAPVILHNGGQIGFKNCHEVESYFLVLRVTLRSPASIQSEGPHPAIKSALRRKASDLPITKASPKPSSHDVPAILQCVHAQGTDCAKLSLDTISIPLNLNNPLEIGRHHQLGFFELLLKSEPKWLSYISRSHCRVVLSQHEHSTDDSKLALTVENLSANAILVGFRPLGKGHSGTIAAGEVLGFVAKPSGDTEEVHFLRFRFRRTPPGTRVEGGATAY